MGFALNITLLAVLGAVSSDLMVHQVTSGHDYALARKLHVGDYIEAIGLFKHGAYNHAKFNLNIMDHSNQYLLHVDFRPASKGHGELVLNNLIQGRWQTEVRPVFYTAGHFRAGQRFHVKVIVQHKHYDIYFNGKKIGHFPFREMPISSASKIRLNNGPQACHWLTLRVHHKPLNVGFSVGHLASGHDYRLKTPLRVGDYIEGTGLFKAGSYSHAKFNLNIMDDKNQYILHVDFRPGGTGDGDLVLNNLVDGRWQTEVRPPFTTKHHFHANHKFKVRVVVEHSGYVILLNGKKLGTFPHRMKFASATKIRLNNGPQACQWLSLTTGQLREALE